HNSAYSYCNLNSKNYYVYTWDGGNNLSTPFPSSGMSFLAYNTGTSIGAGFAGSSVNPIGFPANDAVSIEAVFLQNSNHLFVACTYYMPSTQRFMLNLFSWDGANLNQETGYPIALSVAAPSTFEWIRSDALDLNKFIITWSEGGRIYTKAGKIVNNELDLGNTVQLKMVDMACNQPDVALINVESEELVMAHYAYTSNNNAWLYLASLPFNDVYSALPSSILPITIEDFQTSTGDYLLPRIDAPDSYDKDDWSYVVEENISGIGSSIFVGVMNQSIGLIHRNLNDGTEVGYPTVDLSPLPNTNTKPVVAYAQNSTDIYYCWGYEGNNPSPPGINNYALIGLKID